MSRRRRSYGVVAHRCASTSQSHHETDSDSAAKETPAENDDEDVEDASPPRRYGLYVGAAAVAAVAGISYGLSSSNLMSSYFISRLRADGPTFLDGDGGIGLMIDTVGPDRTVRRAIADDAALIAVLTSALNPDFSVNVQRRAASLLAAVAADDECVHQLVAVNGVAVSLYYAAMGASSPEVSFHAFSALKPVVSVVDDDNATRSRNDLITVGALGGLSRQTRSPAPEVAVTANDVLANLLPFVTDVKRIKLSAAETNNLLSAAAHIGAMYAEQSQPVAAVAAYRIAIALDPNHPQLVTALAVELAKTGAVDEALQLLSKAVALDQHNTIEANFHRLKIAAQRNDAKTDDYIKSLRRALMSAADETHPLLGAAYLLMIQALETAGRLDTAIECAYEWTLRSPAEALPYFTYGRLLLADRATDSAVAALTFADARDPSKSAVKYHLAIASLKQKDVAKAKRYIDEAFRCADMSSASTIAGLHYIRARLALMESDYATALAHINLHIKLAPNHSRAFIDKIRTVKRINDGTHDRSEVYSIWNEFMDKCRDALSGSTQPHKSVAAELAQFSDECSSAANAPAQDECAEMKSACQRLADIQRSNKAKPLF